MHCITFQILYAFQVFPLLIKMRERRGWGEYQIIKRKKKVRWSMAYKSTIGNIYQLTIILCKTIERLVELLNHITKQD